MVNVQDIAEQAVSKNMMITRYIQGNIFQIGYREKIRNDGFVLPGKNIMIKPQVIAEGDNPERFAEMLELLAMKIREIAEIRKLEGEVKEDE